MNSSRRLRSVSSVREASPLAVSRRLDELFLEHIAAFFEDLDVPVLGRHCTAAELLQLDEQRALELRDEWIAGQRTEALCLEILPDDLGLRNYDRYRDLSALMRKRAVVPVVGAGMSRDSGYPLWLEFLKTLSGGDWTSECDDLADSGDYEALASHVLAIVDVARFQEAARRVFGPDREVRGVVKSLPIVGASSVVTLNFDTVIERVFEDSAQPFERVFYGGQLEDAWNSIASGEFALIKLHGDIFSPTSRVLTSEEYVRCYGPRGSNDHARPLPHLLRNLLRHKRMLFLGCSLGPDRIVSVLRECCADRARYEVSAEARHYAFLPLPTTATDPGEVRAVVERREAELAKFQTFPVWYPADGHAAIETLLLLAERGDYE